MRANDCSAGFVVPQTTTLRIAVALPLVFASGVAHVRAQTLDLALEREVRLQVAQSSRVVEGLAFRAQVTSTVTFSQSVEPPKTSSGKPASPASEPRTEQVELAARGPLILRRRQSPLGFVEIQAKNDRYAFQIQQDIATKAATLDYVYRLGDDAAADAKIAQLEVRGRNVLWSPYRMCNRPFWQLFDDPGFRVLGVTRTIDAQSGGSVVRMDYEYSMTTPEGLPEATFSDCYLVFDPGRQWAMIERGGMVQTHFNHGLYQDRVVFDLAEGIAGYPIARSVRNELRFLDEVPSRIDFEEQVDVTTRDVPEDEFFLSYYGLPEPKFETGIETLMQGAVQSDRPWLLYLLAGVACLVAALVMRRRHSA